MRFCGIVVIQEVDKQGDVIDVEGCDVSALEGGTLWGRVEFDIIRARKVGSITKVEKTVDPRGVPCVYVEVESESDLGRFSIGGAVGVGVCGRVLAKDGERHLTKTVVAGVGLTGSPAHDAYRLVPVWNFDPTYEDVKKVNVFGFTPCPKCLRNYRCAFNDRPNVVKCDACGHEEPVVEKLPAEVVS